MLPLLIGGMAAGGLAQGLLGSKKTAGTDAGNAFTMSAEDTALAQQQLRDLLRYKDDPNIVDPLLGSRTATKEVQDNAILGQLFGKEGALSRANAEEQALASRGYKLQPEDYEAYGQASDELARMFGQSDASLAQALQNRGLGASTAMAGQAFAGSQGNKMEQLAGLQRKIANDRMQSNMQRLGQTRQFMLGLGGQAQDAIQQQYGRQMEGANTQFGRLMDKNSAAQDRLSLMQNQSNQQLKQRLATQEQSPWARALSGGIGGAMSGGMLAAQMSGAGGATPKYNTQTGQSLFDPQTGQAYDSGARGRQGPLLPNGTYGGR